jgi:type IV pilus assembly protein PilV
MSMTVRSPSFRRRAQAGSFLLEALIAILVFSLGILGIVGLQARAIEHTNDAQYRSEAVFLASSLISDMWTDSRLVAAGTKYTTAGQPGYDAFKTRVDAQLPGASTLGGWPKVQVTDGLAAGFTATSFLVRIEIHWLAKGGGTEHKYITTAVIGQNQ